MRQRLKLASALLAAAGILVSADCPAQQHRQINAASGHVVLSAPASVGGPKAARASSGPRFPLVPAGALNAAPVAAHRPGAKPRLAANAGNVRMVGPPHPAASFAAPAAVTPAAAALHGGTAAAHAQGASASAGSANAAPAPVNASAPSPQE